MDIIVTVFLVAGLFFFFVGVVGLLRLPDVFCRLHATTKCDTLGAGLILFGLFLHHGIAFESVKLLLIIVFIWLANPTAAHVIARSSYNRKVPMAEGSFDLDYTKEGSA